VDPELFSGGGAPCQRGGALLCKHEILRPPLDLPMGLAKEFNFRFDD